MKTGKVYLVGAGPSDVGLMTVKGRRLMESADVIVYDRLIGNSIMLSMPESAEKIDVGKRAGNHTMPQEQINRLLMEKAREGKTVVRLKGGDPFLFGRGGEELELLAANGIPFEVVPGVPSAISVPAYNGIPVTHRDAASSLHIITGHQRAGKPLDIDFEALVRTKGTLVFLMGVRALPNICRGLLDAGIDQSTPAAVLQQGTTAGQKRVCASVSELAEEAERQGVKTPAIIVVGDVCRYVDEFAWAEQKPLFGHRLVVTRPRARAGRLSGMLRDLGAEVWEIPTISTATIEPNAALDRAMDELSAYRCIAFTSPAGAQIFCEKLLERGKDIRAFGDGKIAAIGQGTVRELLRHGIAADLVPEVYDGRHLGQSIAQYCQNGDKILIPRARNGNKELISEIICRKRVEIDDAPIYDTVYEEPFGIDLSEEINDGAVSMAVFTSASTVKGFERAASGAKLAGVTAVCIGEQTAGAARALGMRTVVAERATLESLVEAAVSACSAE